MKNRLKTDKEAKGEKKVRKKELLINNFGLKIIAVFVAFLVWIMVVNGEDPITSVSINGVKVEILNRESMVNANQVVRVLQDSNKEYTNVTNLRVRGRKSVVTKLTADDFEVKADLKELRTEPYASTESVPIQYKCKNPNIKTENISCSPASLQVSIEEGVEKTFAVEVSTIGQTDTGYELSPNHQIKEGDTVIVWGPQDVVNKIKKVVLPVSVEGLSESTSFKSNYVIYDKNDDAMNESMMENLRIKNTDGKVINESKVTVTLWAVQSLRLNLETTGTPADGYRVANVTTEPLNIRVAGASNTMDELDGLLTIEGAIPVDGASSNVKNSFNIEEYLSDHYKGQLVLERGSVNSISYEVHIEKLGTTTVTYPIRDMTVKGVPSGMDLSLTPADKISMEIQANSEDLPAITADKIHATLDLSSYTKEGTYSAVPVTITLPEGYTLESEVTIAVNLKNAAASAADGEE